MSNIKLLLVNAPPSAGKDTLWKLVKDDLPYRDKNGDPIYYYHEKQANPIHSVAYDVFRSIDHEFSLSVDGIKEKVYEELSCSYREFCIRYSEEFLKPNFGEDILCRLLAGRIKRDAPEGNSLYVITDSGFVSEAVPLIEAFGAENILLVKVTRVGCTYNGDSRDYINLDEFGVKTVFIHNQSLDKYKSDAIKVISDFINPEEPSND